MPHEVRVAADIWLALRAKRGPELLKGLADELATLHRIVGELGRSIEQLRIQQNFPGHLFALDADGTSTVPRLPKALDIDAAQLIEPQRGFYGLEYDGDGLPFRWTGPQRHFSFLVNIDRTTPLLVELDALWLIDEAVQRDLTLLVDGQPLPFRLERGGSGYTGRAVLPPGPEQAATNLTFLLPGTAHAGLESADRRELGLAFRRLSIRPDVAATRTSACSFVCTAAEIGDGHPGFYALEHDPSGVPFRWSGRESNPSFSFSVAIDRSAPVELELRAIAAIDPQRQAPLMLVVDGAEHRLRLRAAGDHLVGGLVLPPRPAAGPTLLHFTVPVLLRPSGADRRELGIAFAALSLRPATSVAAGAHARLEENAERGGDADGSGAPARSRRTARGAPQGTHVE
jgi:hypothetical protein